VGRLVDIVVGAEAKRPDLRIISRPSGGRGYVLRDPEEIEEAKVA
jgi:hypothetical protein